MPAGVKHFLEGFARLRNIAIIQPLLQNLKNIMIRLLMPLMLMLFISACGKTGDLYLPEAGQNAGAETTPTASPVLQHTEAESGSL
jgi:predicted small lipoprotein YifL